MSASLFKSDIVEKSHMWITNLIQEVYLRYLQLLTKVSQLIMSFRIYQDDK